MAINKTIGRNRNTTDTATTAVVALNSTTSTTLSSANINRLGLEIYNNGPQEVKIKRQAASVDNIYKGAIVQSGGNWFLQEGDIHIGEISAMSKAGTPDVDVIES